MSPGERVRRGLRRRGPRAQAPVAAARARHRPLEGAARAGRASRPRRCARAIAERRPAASARGRRGGAPARLALGARPRGARRCRRSPTPRPTRSSSSRTCCATRSPTCCSPTRSTGPVVDEHGQGRGRAVGRDHLPLPLLEPRRRAGHRAGRARDELMPAPMLSRRTAVLAQVQIRDRSSESCIRRTSSAPAGSSTTSTATRTRSSSTSCWCSSRWRSGSRSRSCSRCSRRRRRWARRADPRLHRRPLHAAEPRGVLPAAADHRARHARPR